MTLRVELAERALNARLDRKACRPLAVAFSGGGDSLALLLIAKAWADRAGRPLIALTVDHRLQAQSRAWGAWCETRATEAGAAHEILTWEGPKPARGVPAAAREARHRLIAEAARRAGAKVVLLGHTADDVIESHVMRSAGVRISAPRPWSPSPVWPEGRDLFVLRPLLELRRGAIRDWLAARGETWIDDPANQDVRHPRPRARSKAAWVKIEQKPQMRGATAVGARFGPSGDVIVKRARADQRREDREDFVLRLGAAIACAAGNERPPRRDALERLAGRMDRDEVINATLGGARITEASDALVFARETGDGRGRGCRALNLRPGEPTVWDGRFEARAREPGLTLAPLRGYAAKLNAGQRRPLLALHPAVRVALPAVIDGVGAVSCPTLDDDPRLEIRSLTGGRFAGACGAIDSEADIGVYS